MIFCLVGNYFVRHTLQMLSRRQQLKSQSRVCWFVLFCPSLESAHTCVVQESARDLSKAYTQILGPPLWGYRFQDSVLITQKQYLP